MMAETHLARSIHIPKAATQLEGLFASDIAYSPAELLIMEF